MQDVVPMWPLLKWAHNPSGSLAVKKPEPWGRQRKQMWLLARGQTWVMWWRFLWWGRCLIGHPHFLLHAVTGLPPLFLSRSTCSWVDGFFPPMKAEYFCFLYLLLSLYILFSELSTGPSLFTLEEIACYKTNKKWKQNKSYKCLSRSWKTGLSTWSYRTNTPDPTYLSIHWEHIKHLLSAWNYVRAWGLTGI